MPLRPPYTAEDKTAALLAERARLLAEIRDLDRILDERSAVGDGCPGCSEVDRWRRRAETQAELATQPANTARRLLDRVRQLEDQVAMGRLAAPVKIASGPDSPGEFLSQWP